MEDVKNLSAAGMLSRALLGGRALCVAAAGGDE